MTDGHIDPRDNFIRLIELDKCRAVYEPHLVFVCGGQVQLEAKTNHSIRNMFMNLSAGIATADNKDFVLAENFKDWKDGYRNLSDFENDIAHISSLVVIFLESEGALAEFGLFFANDLLRQKLVVVLDNQYYECESFIKYGLLNPLEELDERLVRAYEINHKEIDKVRADEVKDIVLDISGHCDEKDRTEKFVKTDRGHIIFLIYQIVDLFLALTAFEIGRYLKSLGIEVTKPELSSALFVLKKFNLISSRRRSSQTFFYTHVSSEDRIELHLKSEGRRYDVKGIKIEVANYYRQATVFDSNFRNRVKVIEAISSEGGAK